MATSTWTLQQPSSQLCARFDGVCDAYVASLAQEPTPHRPGWDGLTGLHDRVGFISELRVLQDTASPPAFTVLCLDMDGFTEFNEQFGLACGDALLRVVAARCLAVAHSSGVRCSLGRVGADEFALAVPEDAQNTASRVVQGLQQVLAQPFDVGCNQQVVPTATIGQARLAPRGDAAHALLHAVSARHQGQLAGVAVYGYDAQCDERRLTQMLREAIAADQIQIALQPKVVLATGQWAGLEALARWTTAEGQQIPPSIFIGVAERHNLISALGERVLERSLATLGQWRAQGLPLVPIAVNFSAQQFHRGDTAERVAGALARHGLPAEVLELELTESMLLSNADTATQTLQSLRALGVTLSIDDFGTGYSSLTYLRRFPVHHLKVDPSFVSSITEDADACQIVRLIVQLAHSLRLRCVAEGIETPEQLALLKAMGCDEGQGYLLARPMPMATVAEWLATVPPWQHLFTSPAEAQ